MKPVGEFLILAERVLHDSQTDLLSPVNCLEVLAAPAFPSHHPGFGIFARYRLDEDPPEEAVAMAFRLVRCSEADGEEVIAEYPGRWAAGTPRARIVTNFQMLRLHRAERVLFRIDHRLGDEAWVPGPSCALDVIEVPPPEPAPERS